jgi:hypothetical protein
MLFMLINRTRKDLSPEEFAKLGELAKSFYANIPPGLQLRADWAANDHSCTFSLLETDDPNLLDAVQKPFKPYVDIEVIPVRELSGWGA